MKHRVQRQSIWADRSLFEARTFKAGKYIYICISNRVVERPIQLSGLVESGESDFHAKHIEMEAETRSRASTGKDSRLPRSKK